MAINKTAAHAKGRNVQPLSSTLKFQTLPVDCSGTDWDKTPEDGEWLFFAGFGEAATHGKAELATEAPMACMVWGHRDRSDRSARSDKRVTCLFKESMHCLLGLYNHDATAGNLPKRGDLLLLANAKEDVNGDTNKKRLVAQPTALGSLVGDSENWCVGYVIGGAGLATAGEPLEVFLYDMPRLVTDSA